MIIIVVVDLITVLCQGRNREEDFTLFQNDISSAYIAAPEYIISSAIVRSTPIRKHYHIYRQ
jgi:hypothetical protein